ncbi:hypothetical protein P1X14_12605 [Sphingomonas sp. AOB5]|uniref:hypothetical protein n=1 Tax=Sphingomonas sp. AOB5 TaxID=3034017 RepID=UPI0023F77FE3|nr:hypothetical protein [Sphingomonas sp. AOB5]MDF7776092.1 hypothetical protein [Sphingomonas sp. AOB5]
MRERGLRVGPRWWWIPFCLVSIALGVSLLWWTPNPFAGLAPGERPIRAAMFFKVSGGILALVSFYRLLALKWVEVEHEALMVATLLTKRRHGWSRLTDVQDSAAQYRLVFRSGAVVLPRREYRPADIAVLDEEVKRRRG